MSLAVRADVLSRMLNLRGVMEALYRRALASAAWRRVAGVVKVRPYALFWQEETQRALCAPGGAGRARDRETFEAEGGAYLDPLSMGPTHGPASPV